MNVAGSLGWAPPGRVSWRYHFVSICNGEASARPLGECRRYDPAVVKVLLIDDDRRHSELLQEYCRRFGIRVDSVHDGEEGLRRLEYAAPDLLLLDVMLPGRSGFDICREVRRRGRPLPVIMLTARGEIVDRVSGLEIGADDYVAKPFEPRELVARIHTVLRRTAPGQDDPQRVESGGLSLDLASRTARVDGQLVELTTMEFELLALLVRGAGRSFTRDEILTALRGLDASAMTRSVDILVCRLRGKLGDTSRPPRFIHTIWGRGYRFSPSAGAT